jgi:DNA-binding transcriptional MerR regulator
MPPADADYSIAAVSKLTGISCHALRVWERRYGFPVPNRSGSGHRRYSREQVRLLKRIAELSQTGQAIGDLLADARDGRLKVEGVREAAQGSAVEDAVGELVDLLCAGDLSAGEACFRHLAAQRSRFELVVHVIEPALVDTGERWFRHECEIFQEHCVSGFLQRKLDLLIDEARQLNDRPTRSMVVGTVQGDRHGGGAMILEFVLEQAGWRVLNLGVDLPVREYEKAIDAWRPDALALSFVLSRNINKRFHELSQIGGIPIFVGGRSILNYQGLARRHGLIPVPGPISGAIEQLRAALDQWVRGRKSLRAGGGSGPPPPSKSTQKRRRP